MNAEVHGPQVLLNAEIVKTLLDFVRMSIEPLTSPNTSTVSSLKKDLARKSISITEKLHPSGEPVTVRTKPAPLEGEKAAQGQMMIVASINQPVLALLEQSDSPNPRALVMQVSGPRPSDGPNVPPDGWAVCTPHTCVLSPSWQAKCPSSWLGSLYPTHLCPQSIMAS